MAKDSVPHLGREKFSFLYGKTELLRYVSAQYPLPFQTELCKYWFGGKLLQM